jgi:SNF2 family DNA or RNA helicase
MILTGTQWYLNRIGRLDRIGQQKSTRKIYNFVVDGSIDEHIIETLGHKLGLVEGSVLEPSTVLAEHSSDKLDLFTNEDLAGC